MICRQTASEKFILLSDSAFWSSFTCNKYALSSHMLSEHTPLCRAGRHAVLTRVGTAGGLSCLRLSVLIGPCLLLGTTAGKPRLSRPVSG